MNFSGNKGYRLLSIYERLVRGEHINKAELATAFGVEPKTIQRDIEELRNYFHETHTFKDEVAIKYDKAKNSYYLMRLEREWLTNEEVLAISKILLESRAFNKNELHQLMTKILMQVTPPDRAHAQELLRSEQHYYIPPRHNKPLLQNIWELSSYIVQKEQLHIAYTRIDGVTREHHIKPVAIMFSEFYFYLIAYMADDSKDFPTTFRIDRISEFRGSKKKFDIPYKDRFNDGEFRKRVQFMYGGELRRVTFEYSGPSIEAVLDKLPAAKIIAEKDGVYTLEAEVFGNGIDMWIRSQGDIVRVLQDR